MSGVVAATGAAFAVRIIGRRSSLFTRVALMFAEELGISYELEPIYDMTAADSSAYGANPALKLPNLRRGESSLHWLDQHAKQVLDSLPAHDLSLLEVSLFCLLEHLQRRPAESAWTVPCRAPQ